MLTLNNIEVIYNDVILVLKGMSLAAPEGKIVALLGSNGAGKTTTLKAISGLLKPEDGEVTDGTIEFEGERIDNLEASEIVRRGIFQVMEGRRVFEHLSVEENLRAGAYTRKDRRHISADIADVYDIFPRLQERRHQTAGYLSGGEQQMLAIGRGLMARPRILMLDEPSLGLMPKLVDMIFELVQRINREDGLTILLVEQNVLESLEVADRAYVLETGSLVLEGAGNELLQNPQVQKAYLGM